MITITFKSNPQFIETMRNKGPRIVSVIFTKLEGLMGQLATYVREEKLSGQVLKTQTSNLKNSVRPLPIEVAGPKIIGTVTAAGTNNSFYGRYHEYGGTRAFDVVPVKKRALQFLVDGKLVYAQMVHHPPVIKRPFMSPSEEENFPKIKTELEASVNKVIQE